MAVNSEVLASPPKVMRTATRTQSGGDVVEDVGDEVEEVLADGDEGDAVADDVADELKEGEDDEDHGEGGEDENEGAAELAHDVVVQDEWKLDVQHGTQALGEGVGEVLLGAGVGVGGVEAAE